MAGSISAIVVAPRECSAEVDRIVGEGAACSEVATGRPRQVEVGHASDTRLRAPVGDEVGDDHAVVFRTELHFAAGAPNFPVKDDTIDGAVFISGWQGCWFGFIRNVQHGMTTLPGNHPASSDANEIVSNTIQGSPICYGNTPAPKSETLVVQ
ncbi:MAG: hypothetical protein EPN48_17695 [Microbacteriaceae bacterium]|nr:MAG: hypothetical protein EPN48_17695 [Microbacteriaceae bacterium]